MEVIQLTVKQDIRDYLSQNGRSTVSEISNGTGYSSGWIRRNAKSMESDGDIQGKKVPKRIPAAIINGEFEVLAGSRDDLLAVVRKHAPHLVPEAQSLSADEIRNLIRKEMAERTLAFKQEVWEFW